MNCDFLSCYFKFFERNYNFNCLIEADQLSEYDDDSSDDNESVLEEDGAVHQLLKKISVSFSQHHKQEVGEW